MCRAQSFALPLVAATAMFLCPRPIFASVETAPAFDQVAQAWMGVVGLLAHDGDEHGQVADGHGGDNRGDRERGRGERCGCGTKGCERCGREGDHARGAHPRGNHHRPPHHPHGHHGAAGPGRSPGPHAVVAKMDEILARLGRIEAKLDGRAGGPPRIEARDKRPMVRPEVPEQVREQMWQRMDEGRERMEQARQAFRQMEERIKKLEAEIARLKADR